jgi:hypothetical protein
MEVVTAKGLLKCRKPNVLEVYDYLESVGSLKEENPIKLQGMMIKAIRPYLDISGLEGVASFDDLINDPDNFFKPLVNISDDLYFMVIGVLSKKD